MLMIVEEGKALLRVEMRMEKTNCQRRKKDFKMLVSETTKKSRDFVVSSRRRDNPEGRKILCLNGNR